MFKFTKSIKALQACVQVRMQIVQIRVIYFVTEGFILSNKTLRRDTSSMHLK